MGVSVFWKKEGGLMSDYKDEIDDMCWSYSRITSFENCKYEFFLNYIVNDKEQYLSENNFYAEAGIFVHEILAKVFSGEFTLEEAEQYFRDNFKENIKHKVKKSTMDNTFELCSSYFSEVDLSWLKDYEILGVEMEVKFKISGYDFVGFIDLLLRDKRDGRIVVVDNKSSDYPFKKNGEVKANSKHSFENYKRQMYLYSYAVKMQYGEFPKWIMWNHFKNGGRLATIPFSENEFNQTVDWFVNTIHKIESEEEYKPSQDYFYCTNLCNFRNSCEYRTIQKKRYSST